MLTKNKKRLMVLENFFVDKELPKYAKKNQNNNNNSTSIEFGNGNVDVPSVSGGGSGFSDDGWLTNIRGVIVHNPEDEGYWDGLAIETKNEFGRQFIAQSYDFLTEKKPIKSKNPFLKLAWWFLKKWYFRKYIKQATGTIESFFIDIKQSPQELSKVDEKLKSYKDYLSKLKNSGQTALLEKVENNIYVAGREAVMYANNINKYFTEQQLIDFVLKTEKGLRMDWIKNFTRHIPDEVLNVKIKCDELEIFDNYCILHYDPNNKSVELTEKEKERKKDPILFGLIKGSTNLYFVGDWIDEYCDLTLDKIVETIGSNKEITKDYNID